jgi:hypothetical protein
MSCAAKILVNLKTPFAMRGGGHMPIADADNISSTGILISSMNLQTLELSEDQKCVVYWTWQEMGRRVYLLERDTDREIGCWWTLCTRRSPWLSSWGWDVILQLRIWIFIDQQQRKILQRKAFLDRTFTISGD